MDHGRPTTVLVAGGAPPARAALTRALHAEGVAVVDEATGPLAGVVINAGADWREPGWRACLENVYEATSSALPHLADAAVIVVVGPRIVSEPGAGYREYVKARFVLERWSQELQVDAPTVVPVLLWGAEPELLARETAGRLTTAAGA